MNVKMMELSKPSFLKIIQIWLFSLLTWMYNLQLYPLTILSCTFIPNIFYFLPKCSFTSKTFPALKTFLQR